MRFNISREKAVYSLSVPATTAKDSYAASVRTIQKLDNRSPFNHAAPVVQAACNAFDRLAEALEFDRADSEDFVVDGLTGHTMSDLYDKQFIKGKRTKAIRDSIKNAAPFRLCPYCGEGSVAQLDHYLPKKLFAGTTVHPANLVPSCGDCNFAKRNYKPGRTDPPVLHPYFDTAFELQWLSAAVERDQLGVPVVVFGVDLPHRDVYLEARLLAHMDVFKLWERFSVWAAQSLSNFEGYLSQGSGTIRTLGGARRHLQAMASQESGGRVNSWERAAYDAMYASDWYLPTYLNLQ
ncbi:HNH endonuclease [Arthrobacter sp. FW305-123]|nr:HNH endonuclease [Arthrobacter sp. FW305-123]